MKKMYYMICLGFMLIPFNDVPNIKILDAEFPYSFFWNILFILVYIKEIGFKINIKGKKNSQALIYIYIYILIINLYGITLGTNLSEYLFQIRMLIFSTVYILGSIFLYNTLLKIKKIDYLKKIFNYSLYSFVLTGGIEFLNYYLKIYERNFKSTGNFLRLSPLSSESAYYILTLSIPFSMFLFYNRKNLLNLCLSVFILMSFSATGIGVLIYNYIIRLINYSKKKLMLIFFIIFIISFFNFKPINLVRKEIKNQLIKVYIYSIKNENYKNYSAEIRNKSKEKLGKDIFYLNPIFGKGSGYIYIYGKEKRIQIEGNYIKDAQNFYWTILAQEGLFGLIIYLVFFIWIDYKLIIYLLKHKKDKMILGFLCGVQIFYILLNTGLGIWNQSFWMYLAFSLAWMNIKKKGEFKKNVGNS